MQSKISSFFKPSSSSSSPSSPRSSDPLPVLGEASDDEMAIWVKAEHVFVNTYSRRVKKMDGVLIEGKGDEANKESINDVPKKSASTNELNASLRAESPLPGKVLNKKRSYAQFYLEFGQSDFLLHTCSNCGPKYAAGDKSDEQSHSTFHKNYTQGIQFKVQDVVNMMEIELGEGWIFHKFCKIYLFFSSERVAGCLVAKPIEDAFRVMSCWVSERCNGAEAKKRRSSSTTLQFGNIILQREVVKRAPDNCSQLPDGNHHGAIICEEDAVPAACGVRAIRVTPSNRRRGIASLPPNCLMP